MKEIGEAIWAFILQWWSIFCGADGKLSGRRILGTVFLVTGLIELVKVGLKPWPSTLDVWTLAYALGPGVILTLVGSWFWQWISEQNIKAIAEGLKR